MLRGFDHDEKVVYSTNNPITRIISILHVNTRSSSSRNVRGLEL